MDVFTHRQMEELPPIEQAKKAIAHVLSRIREDAAIGWYLGIGTESFALLTEAAATLLNEEIAIVRQRCNNPNAANPADGVTEQDPDERYLDADDLLDGFSGLSTFGRIDFLERLKSQFCMSCGGHRLIKTGPCVCQPLRQRRKAA